MNIMAWLRQPTTIHALGVVAAAVGAGLSQLTTGDATVDSIVAVLAYVLVHAGIPDNTAPK